MLFFLEQSEIMAAIIWIVHFAHEIDCMKLLLFIDYANIVKILLQTTQIGLHLANYKFWYEFKK